ncbi:MAG TPA: histidine kinase dimerization/phosphoacceptor domain -containing protein [Xanthobacteraceae bacterium]|nr:histidine kinase dimerization/phosphoacceptor domain -containing protein [Xanthobacteraceae bacterium]
MQLAVPAPSDLTVCDLEPIHIPGSIQPHGLLLVADAATGLIVAGAGDIEGRLTAHWHGRPLAQVLGTPVVPPFAEARHLGVVAGAGERFDAVLHPAGAVLLVELEAAEPAPQNATEVLAELDRAALLFERALDIAELGACATRVFRQWTGYDRVMLYQFLDDDSGVVVAEDRVETIGSFLNHRFPASDIPRQARALYIRNRVRVIPDIAYVPAPLRPALPGLDLSDVALRSVSPIHIQYLKNMGVAASASISIVRDGVLWGLIACHNATPKPIPHTLRIACRTLAAGLGRQIVAKDEAAQYRDRLRLRTVEDAVKVRIGSEMPLPELFDAVGVELRQAFHADGFAAIVGRDHFQSGLCPDHGEIERLAHWLAGQSDAVPFSTHALSSRFPPAQAYRGEASGLLACVVATEEPVVLMWFRAEHISVVNWAGNPHKDTSRDPAAELTPRTSFEAWSETVQGEAPRWSLAEIDSVKRLARSVSDARQARRMRDLNRELTATNAENERLLLQKDFLMREVNHRVQNSLQLVSSFLHLQGRAAGDATVADHLDDARRRVAAVALVHRQLYGGDELETVDLSRYLADLCGEMEASMGAEWKQKLSFELAPIVIQADRAVKMGLILTELIINAVKYAYGGAIGPISIALEQHRNRLRLVVADRGAGKSGGRRGFGTRMLVAMVGALAGEMEEEGNNPGLRVVVTVPIQPVP